ncbi:hypothetical protein J3459_016734 [Metarhizium acridum]|nr:hypothetical protein J3459_016734 [Metarhizium acridum]
MPAHQYYYQAPGHNIAAGVVLSSMVLIVVGARFWTRLWYRQGIKADDLFIIPATVLTVATGILIVYGTVNHAIAYRTEIPVEHAKNPLAVHSDQLTLTSKIEYPVSVMLPVILGCTKLSFLLFYRRIFATHSRGAVNVVLVGFMVLIGLWTLAFFFATVFYCKTNFFAIWGSALDLMTFCTKGMLRSLALCISDFTTDVFIIAFPIPLIYRLELSPKKKAATAGIFLLGAVTVATSLARMVTTIRIVKAGFDPDEDEVFVITTWVYWGMVECSTGILAACVPTLSFFTKSVVFQRPWDTLASVFGTQSQSSPAGHNGHSENSVGEDTLPYKAGNGGAVHVHSKLRPSHDTTEEAYEMVNRRSV